MWWWSPSYHQALDSQNAICNTRCMALVRCGTAPRLSAKNFSLLPERRDESEDLWHKTSSQRHFWIQAEECGPYLILKASIKDPTWDLRLGLSFALAWQGAGKVLHHERLPEKGTRSCPAWDKPVLFPSTKTCPHPCNKRSTELHLQIVSEPSINKGISEACPQAFACNIQAFSALLFLKLNLHDFIIAEVFLPFSPCTAAQRQQRKTHVVLQVTAELTQHSSLCSLASCKCSFCVSARCTLSRLSLMAQGKPDFLPTTSQWPQALPSPISCPNSLLAVNAAANQGPSSRAGGCTAPSPPMKTLKHSGRGQRAPIFLGGQY